MFHNNHSQSSVIKPYARFVCHIWPSWLGHLANVDLKDAGYLLLQFQKISTSQKKSFARCKFPDGRKCRWCEIEAEHEVGFHGLPLAPICRWGAANRPHPDSRRKWATWQKIWQCGKKITTGCNLLLRCRWVAATPRLSERPYKYLGIWPYFFFLLHMLRWQICYLTYPIRPHPDNQQKWATTVKSL